MQYSRMTTPRDLRQVEWLHRDRLYRTAVKPKLHPVQQQTAQLQKLEGTSQVTSCRNVSFLFKYFELYHFSCSKLMFVCHNPPWNMISGILMVFPFQGRRGGNIGFTLKLKCELTRLLMRRWGKRGCPWCRHPAPTSLSLPVLSHLFCSYATETEVYKTQFKTI